MSFYLLLDQLEWNDYTGSWVEAHLSKWKLRHGQRMSTCLHNKMDAKDGHAHYRYDICKETCHNKKTYSIWQRMHDKTNIC